MFLFLFAGVLLVRGAITALFALYSGRLGRLSAEDRPAACGILPWRKTPQRQLVTILLINTLLSIGIVRLANHLIRGLLAGNGGESPRTILDVFTFVSTFGIQGFAIIFCLIILLILFWKVLAVKNGVFHGQGFAMRISGPMNILMVALFPLSRALRRRGSNVEDQPDHDYSSDSENGALDKGTHQALALLRDNAMEAGILKSIGGFSDVAVRQIMRSRLDMVALPITMTWPEMLQTVRVAGYSRFPVFVDSLDRIRGILHVKDLIAVLDSPMSKGDWVALIRREVLYVPESRKINEVLTDFQREHLHMAIVVDEYGGTSGLVTLEDIIEEVIGDIKDEFDEDQELEYRRLGEKEFIFEGKTMLIDVCRIMGVDKMTLDGSDGEADSLAGLVLELNGRMPVVGQKVELPPFSFTVLSVSARRIERIKVQSDT